MKSLFLFAAVAFYNTSYCQSYRIFIKNGDTTEVYNPVGEHNNSSNEIFTFVEYMPEPGYDVYKYIESKLEHPNDSGNGRLPSGIAVKFIVLKDGSIDSAHIQGKEYFPAYEKEAVRVVKSMPPWKPGKQNGKPVDVWYTIPVNFKF